MKQEMLLQRNEFIHRLIELLHGKDYILLKFIEPSFQEIDPDSDLDLLLSESLTAAIVAMVEADKTIVRFSYKSFSAMKQLFLYFEDNSFLQIDCLYKLIRKDLVYLDNTYLSQQRKIVGGVQTYSRFCLFEHLIFFNQLNYAGIPEKYYRYFEALPKGEQNSILDKFHEKYKFNIDDFKELTSFNGQLRAHLVNYLKAKKENNGLACCKHYLNYLFDTAKGLTMHRGFLISFTGVDGAGKSTILEDTRILLTKKFRRKTVVLRHRPSLLPILSAWKHGRKKAEQLATEKLPRQGNNNSKWSSSIRFAYYYMDYLIGRIYVFLRYEMRGYIVLFDRYYFDFIIDGKRTNLNLGKKWPKFLYRFVQKPMVNFFLYAPAEIILQRKKELSPEAISSLTIDYKNLFQQFSDTYPQKYVSIKNIDRTETLQYIIHHLKNIL